MTSHPQLYYPPDLPVSEHREEILAALRHHTVVIVCGDTGSGKTTQLPKMALEMRGRRIACTQPRRLAAVTMAERVAAELKTEVGGLVGYQHRFGRRLSPDTRIKFMTDGVLLAETRTDPLLRAYDVIIVDEAHERSLNVDFLLGILKRVLARRRDLKVIVSSATLDTERFAAFFDKAPVISVPGRLFPITIGYRPPPEGEELDLPHDVANAVDELPPKDDILVFLPGERDIRETAERLSHTRPGDDIIPLLASLPASEQQRAFKSSPRRRIILATNVAETSVTIPGIRCVIDSGLARISRYIHRTQIQRLQIEPISQASARQRAGRCGRLGPGTCLRLYSEEDFNTRDAYTPPEVLRSSLAGVILTMLDLKLGDIALFPFIDPPKPTMVREGLRELLELGAICHGDDGEPALTATGRKLAKIPVEPRLARMLLAASENATLPTVLPIVAAMACDDPRRRPIDEKQKADQQHAPFRVPDSDFLGTLKLWQWWEEKTKDLSQAKVRKLCKEKYLSYPKMREWRDLTRQLETLAKRLGLSFSVPKTTASSRPRAAEHDDAFIRFHQSLLSGLLGRIGRYDEEEHDYRGAHGLRFALHPSSTLAKKRRDERREARDKRSETLNSKLSTLNSAPPWIMAGELVDTARLFARNAAVLDPRWIEPVAGELCRHHVHSPEYDPLSGFVRATEQVTLYGLVIVPARRCDFSRYNLPFAREIFIRRALVDGDFPHPPPLVRDNNALLDALRKRAEKSRHPEVFDAEKIVAHFASVIPADVANANDLRKWLKRCDERSDDYAAFRLKKADWWPSDEIDSADFPDSIRIGGAKMSLTYRHAPDEEEDGLTCTVRKSDAAILRLWRADWLVPGMLPEKLTWMITTLPSALRRVLTPIDDTVAGLLAHLKPGSEPLADAVRHTISEQWGFLVPSDAWDNQKLPAHLRVRFRIRDDATGRTLAASRDLDLALEQAGITPDSSSSVSVAPSTKNQAPSTTWTFGTLPEKTKDAKAGWQLEHFPALHDEGNGVTLRIYADAESAAAAHANGVTRLYLLALDRSLHVPFRRKQLPFGAQLYVKSINYADEAISEDILAGAVRDVLVRNRPPVRTTAEFERRLREGRNALVETQYEISKILVDSFTAAADIENRLSSCPSETADSLQTQLAWLLFRGFPRHVPLAQLRHYARYLRGASIRIDRARTNPSGDLTKEKQLAPYWELYEHAVADRSGKYNTTALADYRWMLEEYRVSLFAQELHTPVPVSPKRLTAQWGSVEKN